MSDLEQELLLDNLVEALKQVQQYTALGLGTSLSALVLALRRRARGAQAVTVPGTFVAIDANAAHAVLLVLSILVGAIACLSADTANLIADRLRSAPDLLAAALTFPSLATSVSPWISYVTVLLPLVFSVVALLVPALRQRPVDWRALLGWLTFLVPPYAALTVEICKLLDVS